MQNNLTVFIFKVNPQNRIVQDTINTQVRSKSKHPKVVSLSNGPKGEIYQVHDINRESAIRTFENSSI